MGRAVALPLAAGTLLTETDLGPGADPPERAGRGGLGPETGAVPAGGDSRRPGPGRHQPQQYGRRGGRRCRRPREPPSSCPRSPPPSSGCSRLPQTTSDSAVVEVQLAEGDGAAVATAASAGDIALVLVSPGSTS